MPKRLTTDEFIEKARAVHGDRYDYSRVQYKNNTTKVTILCSKHGSFSQTPSDHLCGCGCDSCAGRRPLTTESFIQKAIAIHGNRYDYARVEYSNNKTPVVIVCLDHGDFLQAPTKHLSGSGCIACARTKKLTTAEFIRRSKAVHGDYYDYSRSQYLNSTTPITIVCPAHGPFEQLPSVHYHQKNGCSECSGKKRLTKAVFIERSRSVHGDRYDYSDVEYLNSKAPVTIICPDHGPFEQSPTVHYRSKCGCPECGGSKPLNTRSFIEKSRAKHGDRYDYSKTIYRNSKTSVTIICPEHGPFEQFPNLHYFHGNGCGACAGNKRHSTQSFIEKSIAIHGDVYDYSKVVYKNMITPVTIICNVHGPFDQTPANHTHIKAQGCPDCAKTGFNPSDRGILYYIAISTDDGDTRYKIGITNTTVEQRFRAPDLARIRTIKIWSYAVGRAAAEREAEILRLYAGDKYTGPPILSSGNTELFTHDILGLDKITATGSSVCSTPSNL